MDRVVYDSALGIGARCPRCGKRADKCRCSTRSAPQPRGGPALPRDGIVRILRDRKQRGGKTVTVVAGLPGGSLPSLALELKRACGTGGTVKGDTVEIQGDHRERVATLLRERGFTVKLAGA